MPLSSKQIVDLAVRHANTAGRSGAIEAARWVVEGRLGGKGTGGKLYGPAGPRRDPAAERFLEAIADQPQREQPSPYSHPGDNPQRTGRPGGATSLSDSDRMWLARLPSDPAQISYNDATQLAGMVEGLSGVGNRSDLRLLTSIWRPVKAFHDKREAETKLANANIPYPPIPPATLDALTDAVAREVPALNANEARQRAEDALHEAVEERETRRDLAIAHARSDLAELELQARRSQAVTV